MVFSSLDLNEKQAFFDLLDEYFQSRPELLRSPGNTSSNVEGSSSSAAASAVRNALASNPEATTHLISTGLRRGAQTSSSVKNSPFAAAAANPAIASSVGRFAAASLAFQGNNQQESGMAPPVPAGRNPSPQSLASRTNAPSFPQRTPSPLTEESANSDGQIGRPPMKTIGRIDTSQWSKSSSSSTTSPSFAKRHDFAPPPTRRVSDLPPAAPKRSAPPEPEPDEGEWAEALYDYDSGETGDLTIRAEDRIKIISRDSDDWWTGEINGRSGLFPATYVKKL